MPASPPRVLFAGLVDDAALFPPGNAPMPEALAAHARHRGASYGDLVGPFVCPASRVEELLGALPGDQSVELSLVFDVTGDGAHRALRAAGGDDRVSLVSLEAAHARLGDDATVVGENLRRLPAVVGFLEVPRTGFEASLALVADGGWQAAKYRTGGTSPDAFPTEAELAAFLAACAGRGLPFKLTAGLHHAVRHTDPRTGFEHPGVLNVLVATAAARRGASVGELAGVLAERRPEPLVAAVRGWTEADCLDVRRSLRSFGCCGVTDPIDDLATLGLVEEVAR